MIPQNEAWFQFLDHSMRDLASTSYILLDMFQNLIGGHSEELRRRIQRRDIHFLDSSSAKGGIQNDGNIQLHDFSFIVFPLAKAYEGFLKKWLYVNRFIPEAAYKSDHFRLGKSLNPSLPKKYQRDWYVYDDLVIRCFDPHLADRLWQTWKICRNLLFHYFPHHQHFLKNIPEAEKRINQLTSTMTAALLTPLSG